MTVQEIQRALEQLPLSELAEVAAWIERRQMQGGHNDGSQPAYFETVFLTKSQAEAAPSQTQAMSGVFRDHKAFLNSYAPEDEGLYQSH